MFGLPWLRVATIKMEFKNTFNITQDNIKEIKTSRSNPNVALDLRCNQDKIWTSYCFALEKTPSMPRGPAQ